MEMMVSAMCIRHLLIFFYVMIFNATIFRHSPFEISVNTQLCCCLPLLATKKYEKYGNFPFNIQTNQVRVRMR